MANNTLLASDNFASGSLAAGWSFFTGLGTAKCAITASSPYYAEPAAITNTYGQVWTGLTWAADQICEVTVQTLNSTGTNTLGLLVRATASSASGYQANIANTSGTVTLAVYKLSGGTATQIGSTVTGLTSSSGDVWTLAAIGAVILVYHNNARVFYIADTTTASGGYPAFELTASTAVTNCQVASWRGYGVQQQNGIWTSQGCILPGTATEMSGSPSGNAGLSVNYGPSAFLNVGSNVYRGYWVYRNSGTPELAYGESLDGKRWSRYPSNPVIPGYGGGVVSCLNDTSYMWGQSSPGTNEPNFFTSPDGVTWTNKGQCTGLTVSGYSMYSPCLIDIIGGTYYVLVSGLQTANGNLPSTWLATATDGLTFTIQNSGNPLFSHAFAGANIFKIGSTYYLPATANQPGQTASGATNFNPVYGALYQCSDPTFITWTLNSVIEQNQLLNDSFNNPRGGTAPYCMIDVNGTAFHYYQGSPSDGIAPADYQCMLATAPTGVKLAQVVTASQTGIQQTAVDNLTSGTGNLPAINPNWTTPSWSTTLQVVSGPVIEATLNDGSRCTAVYTGASFSRYQYSEATLQALVTGSIRSNLYLLLCATTTGNQQAYYTQLPSPTGSQSSGVLFSILKVVNGVQTMLSQATTTANQITPQVGDKFRFAVWPGSDGSNILRVYQNGVQVLEAQDYAASLTSGNPGIQLNASTSVANAQISLWAGGNTNVIPNYPSAGGSWMQPQRDFVNKRGVFRG